MADAKLQKNVMWLYATIVANGITLIVWVLSSGNEEECNALYKAVNSNISQISVLFAVMIQGS